MGNKFTINLLQADLLPKKVWLTLKRVVLAWSLTFTLLLLVILITQYQINLNANQLQRLQITKLNQTALLSDLEVKLSQNKPNPLLISKLNTLKLLMDNKQKLHQELTNNKSTYVVGFARAMTDLASMHSREISLNKVVISQDNMAFFGLAKSPDSVPAWLAKFEYSSVLAGKNFSHFSLKENENKLVDFVVSTHNSDLKANN